MEKSQMKNRLLFLCHLVMVSAVAMCAHAESLTYNLNFSGGAINPTSGSFTYNTTTEQFTSFNVNWDGVDFNILGENNPVSQNSCPFVNGQQVFAILTGGGECDGSPLSNTWAVFPPNPPGGTYNP